MSVACDAGVIVFQGRGPEGVEVVRRSAAAHALDAGLRRHDSGVLSGLSVIPDTRSVIRDPAMLVAKAAARSHRGRQLSKLIWHWAPAVRSCWRVRVRTPVKRPTIRHHYNNTV